MLKTYKNYIFLTLGLLWSIGLWNVSGKYHLTEITQKQLTQERSDTKKILDATAALETKLTTLRSTQTTINQKVIRETIEKPVYRQCLTTDGVVRDIESAIDAGH